jgi:uncharacterized protein (TIGR04255 family)
MADRPQSSQVENPVTFGRPPVTEVVLGVQFAGSVTDDATTLGDFWPQIREEYPTFERQPPLAPLVEGFEAPLFDQQLDMDYNATRYWFTTPDQHWLVQVQSDRFVINWRRIEAADVYPRYRTVRSRFQKLYGAFMAVLDDQRVAANPPRWCATTYINQIPAGEPGKPLHRTPLARAMRLVSSPKSTILPAPEQTHFRQSHVLQPEAGESTPRGRFYIEAAPSIRMTDQVPGYSLELKVVSQPDGPSRAALLRCFDAERDLIVRSFKDITTPDMHRLWELEEAD